MAIAIHQGSILDSKADCIVNPANSFLRHGGGLAAVIAKAAAPPAQNPGMDEREWYSRERLTEKGKAWYAEQGKAPLIATGNVWAGGSGELPYKAIIHAVGPIYNGGDYCESDLLEIVHENAIGFAEVAGFASIALPAISCGIYGYPVEKAAPIAVNVASWTDLDVEFWLFEDAHVAAYTDAFEKLV